MSHAMEEVPHSAVPLADLSVIDHALSEGDEALKSAVRRVRPADLGADLSRRSVKDARRIVAAADERHASAMLRAAHPSVAAAVLSEIDVHRAARILAFLPTDDEVAILSSLPADCRPRYEEALEPDDKANVQRILAYDPTAVGRLMTPMIWKADKSWSVAQAMASLRDHRDDIEVAVNCHVVDGSKLVGVVPLRELATSDPAAKLADVMTPDPISVVETAPRGDAAEIIQRHDFLSLPVVDPSGRLVGAVRVDDLLDAALDKVGAGFLNQGGVAGKIAAAVPYFQTRMWKVVRSRLTWLVLLFVAETATGTVLRHFEDELAKVVALSFFVPLLIGTGGNAGSQTVSTIIRALALGEIRRRDVLRVVAKELIAGLTLGLLLGTIAFFRAKLWGVGWDLCFCVGITVLVVCTWANAVGSLIPLAADMVGVDPTVISAPMITTLVDASGLFIYFTVAHLTLKALQ